MAAARASLHAAPTLPSGAVAVAGLLLRYTSPDGEEGPGPDLWRKYAQTECTLTPLPRSQMAGSLVTSGGG